MLGRPVRLVPFQRFILDRKWEHDGAGRLLYDRILVGMAKGNAKTELFAEDATGRLAGPLAPLSPNIPVAAASWEQANRLFGAARLSISAGPLGSVFGRDCLLEDRILNPTRPGTLMRIAAVAGTNDGGLPSDVYEDELHEWSGIRRERVDVVLGNGLKKRAPRAELPDGRVIIGGQLNRISTAGDDPGSLLRRLYDHGVKVATGEVVDPSFLFLWWEASELHDLDTEEGLLAAILEANPAAGSFLDADGIAARFHDPTLDRYEWERYHGNRWVSPPAAWISLDRWNARVHDTLRFPPNGSPIALGFDGSISRDSTALVGCTPEGHLFTVATWERPSGDPEWTVPRAGVDAKVAEAFRRWNVSRLYADPPRWEREIEDWAAEFGAERVLAFPTYVAERFAPQVGAFHDAVMTGSLTHDGDPVLARHIANARTKETRWGLVITKENRDSPRRIDAAVAAVLAADGITAPAPKVVSRRLLTW